VAEEPESDDAAFEAVDEPEPSSDESTTSGLKGRVKRGLFQVAKATYDARADDLQERAIEAMREALTRESERLIDLAKNSYDDRADDIEERAVRAIRKVFDEEADRLRELVADTYDSRADDLEQRAARALRAALIHESRRIQALLEHSVTVKRKEVRLSLLVLVVANLIYLCVYWVTGA
jgi:DNA anti-recombination protein RmuC